MDPQLTSEPLFGTELDRRSARKDGREIVTIRCVEADGMFVIESDVYPVDGLRVEPLRPGPYRFRTRGEADAFIAEVVTCLTYLGCEVS
ncbi:MAG TPA: hypothetical protein VGJ49_05105 [Gaiellaceae bacterium]|jgi:hypothetical protein